MARTATSVNPPRRSIGVHACIGTGRSCARKRTPALFVQGSADPINPPAASLQLYQADATGTRYYLDVLRAGHLTPYEGDRTQEQLVARVTTEFLDR
jgi:hypothetical protein